MTTNKHMTTLLIAMLVVFTGLVNAQMSTTFKAQVPFAFVANGQTMPAGECKIAVMGNGRTMLSITSGREHAFSFSVADRSPNPRKELLLVFHQYGDRYFLAGIKHPGGAGYELPPSKLETELRAGNVTGKEFTLLASAE